MSTQAITDYLTKQLFIEKNIVTYRLLSRQFSIHVNEAKNELAIYHHDAPYQSQTCQATFLISGIPKPPARPKNDDDYDMDSTPNATQEEEDESGEEVPQAQITIVNEKDFEEAKASYAEITSIHVYSLSPALIHDAGLLCAPTEIVRSIDKEKGAAFSAKLGCIVGKGIKMGGSKKKPQPKAPVAGPSRINVSEPKVSAKSETKESAPATTDKGKEKPKATGKLQFFTKPKEPVNPPVKKEEPADSKKKMFFSKPAAPAKSVEPTVSKEEKEVVSKNSKNVPSTKEANTSKDINANEPEVSRGMKRKSSVGLEARKKSPENPATTSKTPAPAAETHGRSKRRVVLSDDEEFDTIVSKPARRKARASYKTESTENSDAERDARALMDIDDDQVEKVSRVPSTNASSNELDDDDDQDASPGVQDEDVSMEDEAPVKPKPKPRKPKNTIPIGSNGLKKKKITKTRRIKDANGYLVREDYSDWESVEEGAGEVEAPAPKPAAKAKAEAVAKVKKEEDAEDEASSQPKKAKATEPAPVKKAPAKSAAKAKPAAKGTSVKGKSQQTLNFFGPKKT